MVLTLYVKPSENPKRCSKNDQETPTQGVIRPTRVCTRYTCASARSLSLRDAAGSVHSVNVRDAEPSL